ncbi:hypothetical protein VMCG_05576 [Cytospora schulzeri]|uniref:Adenosine deaminase domain-containing protein n=1 Tax=Cytospora schulzeri TaxID=448051 RepID=A0A423WEN3_9PEZI|nr:hypothetical protein VMCG_05576 [Valsa malicola]
MAPNGDQQIKESFSQRVEKLEKAAAPHIQKMKAADEAKYGAKKVGGRYLDNKATIRSTELYKLAYKAPKGGHLHIHFNSCLGPNVLLDIAAENAIKHRMYISIDGDGALTKVNLHTAKIQFHFLAADEEKVKSIFDSTYKGRKPTTPTPETHEKMLFKEFLDDFEEYIGRDALPRNIQIAGKDDDSKGLAMRWLQQKLVFSAGEVTYDKGSPATVEKQWRTFNTRTQMMKGLFNYEYAYRRYTRLLLSEFVKENVHFDLGKIDFALKECLAMKKDPKIGLYIAGFDVIGPENKPHCLKYFRTRFQQFQQDCENSHVKCPFLFHAGESHEDPDDNLSVAMELGSKRIAHGFCIPDNHRVQTWAKNKQVCVECCPISNEILGLAPFIEDAVVYKLMAKGIPCALASDNPTIFSSNLSYDFYQFMIGDQNFILARWRKLMKDSLTHAVWNSEQEKNTVVKNWEGRYIRFLQDIIFTPNTVKEKVKGQSKSSGHKVTSPSVQPAAVTSTLRASTPPTDTNVVLLRQSRAGAYYH